MQYLVQYTYIGYYYIPTQATILALRAILGYLKQITPIQGTGTFKLTLEGTNFVATEPFASTSTLVDPMPTLTFDTAALNLQPGQTYTFVLSVEDYAPSNDTN